MRIKVQKASLGMEIVGKFAGMRKEQSFSIYPAEAGKVDLKIQSKTRMGTLNRETGLVKMSPPCSSGAYYHHLSLAIATGKAKETKLTHEELQHLNEKMDEYYETRRESKNDSGIFIIGG